MKKQFLYSIILLSCLTLTSCGPSQFELEGRKILGDSLYDATNCSRLEEVVDSARQVQQSKPKVTPVKKEARFYYATDFNLVPGTVVDFSPNSEWISSNSEGGIVNEQIYIHIKDETGGVRVFPIDYKTWLVLGNDTEDVILK